MAIIIDENTGVLVQGITGNEGMAATKSMLEYGTKVVAGVTPGKGGQDVGGVPVYNSIKEAISNHPEINTSIVYVPPFAAKDAAFEAISNGIKVINIITESIPMQDSAKIISYAKKNNARIVGPSSVGIISPGHAKIGVIGGSKENIKRIYKKGQIGIISKSGGMTNELSWVIQRTGLGQSTVASIGGDALIGSTFADMLELFENDKQTKGVVMFGEVGGTYEEEAALAIKEKRFTKPLVAFIAGRFADAMPKGMKFGHAGALISNNTGSPEKKVKLLKEAGVIIAENHDECGELIKKAIESRN